MTRFSMDNTINNYDLNLLLTKWNKFNNNGRDNVQNANTNNHAVNVHFWNNFENLTPHFKNNPGIIKCETYLGSGWQVYSYANILYWPHLKK